MIYNDSLSIDYIRYVVLISGATDFLEFAKDEQYYRVLNAAVDLGIIDELFPDSPESFKDVINRLKKFGTYHKFTISGKQYSRYRGVLNINNFYHYIWPDEFEYIPENVSKELLIKILSNYIETYSNAGLWKLFKKHYVKLYHYIFDVLYPIPFDYDLKILSIQAYLYMIEHNMTEYPRSLVYKKYVKFSSSYKSFNVFSSEYEKNHTKEGIEYVNKQRAQTILKKYGVESYTQTEEFKEKYRQTNLKKYGVESYTLTDEFKQKVIETNRLRYGVDYTQQSKEIREKTKKSMKEHWGYEYPSQVEEIRNKVKETCLERYGVENPSQAEVVKKKKEETTFKHFGVRTPFESEEIKKKIDKTNLERYGNIVPLRNKELFEKMILTNISRYGVEFATQAEEIKNKTIMTNLLKYGVEYTFLSEYVKEKIKLTNLERYGFEYATQSEEIKNKTKNTNLLKYGVEYIGQCPEVKEKQKQTNLKRYGVVSTSLISEIREKQIRTLIERYGVRNPMDSPEIRERIKNTMLRKYGVECVLQLSEIVLKSYETRKANNSFNKSKEEDYIYYLLLNIFGEDNIERQYKSERYLFNCDFYIKPLDMFIEYQGFWSHNNHPFDPESSEDLKILELWKSKSDEHKIYYNAINVWTKRDPLKRMTARINKLNYVELWNIKEANVFINELETLYKSNSILV